MGENEIIGRLDWRQEEVVAFLESIITDNSASNNEIRLYEEYHRLGRLIKNNTYKMVIRKMKREWYGE